MENIELWWKKKGARQLNTKLVELVGQNIGFVPIENLLDIKLDSNDLKRLSELLSEDGLEVRQIVNQDKYFIFIK